MMHVDKNADDHVMDQNTDRISREIAYVPLGGGIRSKRSSCKQNFFFFFFFLVSIRYAYLEDDGSWLMFSEDQGFLGFGSKVLDPGSCFQRPRILDLGSCFQRTKGFGALAHVFRGPKVPDPGSCFQRPRILGLGSCFQRTKGSESWLMFSEA